MNETVRVLMTKRFHLQDIAYMKKGLMDNIKLLSPEQYTASSIAEAVKVNINVLLGEMITEEILDNANSLELIQIPWNGLDRLNFELLRKYSYTICNSHSNAAVVAEYGVGLLLAVTKQIPFHDRELRAGRWWRPQEGVENSHRPSVSICDMTIGFIGFGAIAQKITGFLSGFPVRFVAVTNRDYIEPPAPLSKVVTSEELDQVISEVDCLFLTVPLIEKTRGLINKRIFERMKSTAYLINLSRGAVVVEEDLYNALKTKSIAGAAIDTWYNYPNANHKTVKPSRKYPFEELDNLVLSPHRAGFVRKGHPHLDDVIENLNRLATGKELINVVDLKEGYSNFYHGNLKPSISTARLSSEFKLPLEREEPKTFYQKFGKRMFDFSMALFALITLSPVIALLAFVIKLTMGTPILFRQQRPGLREELFTILKFRTIIGKQGANSGYLQSNEQITPLGRILRKLSLDELPQLWNVLRGDMSLVGPRPLFVSYLPYYSARERKRHTVRPGITGLAQVSGRNLVSWSERLELDVQYVERISFKLDIRVLLKTSYQVIRMKNVMVQPGSVVEPLNIARQKDPSYDESAQ